MIVVSLHFINAATGTTAKEVVGVIGFNSLAIISTMPLVSVPIISVGNTCYISAAVALLQALPFSQSLLQGRHSCDSVLDALGSVWHAAFTKSDFVCKLILHFLLHSSKRI